MLNFLIACMLLSGLYVMAQASAGSVFVFLVFVAIFVYTAFMQKKK